MEKELFDLYSPELAKIHLKLFVTASFNSVSKWTTSWTRRFNVTHLWTHFLIWLLLSMEAPIKQTFKVDGLLNLFYQKENMYTLKHTKIPAQFRCSKLQWCNICYRSECNWAHTFHSICLSLWISSLTEVYVEAKIVRISHQPFIGGLV